MGPLNIQQGIARLAIVLGFIGAAVGGFYSQKALRNVPSERYQHKIFENLAASDIVQREHSLLQMAKDNRTSFDWPLTTEVDKLEANQPRSSTLLANEIKAIFWKPDLTVDFFYMQDGGTVSSGPAPSAWLYSLWVVYPSLGFVSLWGLVRGIGWVTNGFIHSQAS